jgi:hypothetical protein
VEAKAVTAAVTAAAGAATKSRYSTSEIQRRIHPKRILEGQHVRLMGRKSSNDGYGLSDNRGSGRGSSSGIGSSSGSASST